jgi:hypothetical protein
MTLCYACGESQIPSQKLLNPPIKLQAVLKLHGASKWYNRVEKRQADKMGKLDSASENLEAKLTSAYEIIEHRLTILWSTIDAIDTKTNIILGFASVVLVILAGFFSLEPSKWQPPSLVLFFLALLSYVILVIVSTLSYRIKGWSYRPDPATLIRHCQDNTRTVADIREWVVNECESACSSNLAMLQKKSKLTNLVLYLFAAETLLLAFGLAYTLIIY